MTTKGWNRLWVSLLWSSGSVGCLALPDTPPEGHAPTEYQMAEEGNSVTPFAPASEPHAIDLYPQDRVVEVALTLDPADWDKIRAEGRSTNEVYSGCLDPSFAYTTVSATVRIDGETFDRVGVRKKGFLGSLSTWKPSLRVDFNAFDARQTLHGQKDLTLNNSRSDSSLVRQCLAYRLFSAAGIPAPRCSFVHLTENGAGLGVYVNIEPMKKPFLRRHYQNPEGTLYEGSLGADFRGPNLVRFEKKTNERERSVRDLERVAEALEYSGESMLERLEPLVNLEQFYRFWAMETLTGHYNGYTGSLNNFMIYNDPSTGKFEFLPWGTDGSFSRTNSFLPAGERPVTTSAWSRLADRLYAYEPTRRHYREVLRSLLDTVWKEAEIVAEIDRMALLLGNRASTSALKSLRTFVSLRREDVLRELSADVPWTLGERPFTFCAPEMNTPVSGAFVAPRDAAPSSHPDTTLQLLLDGRLQSFDSVLVSAGRPTQEDGSREAPSLTFVGRRADGGSAMVRFNLNGSIPSTPRTVTLHGFEASGSVYAWKRGARSRFVGYIGKGRVVFEQAGSAPGSSMTGRFEGTFLQTQQSKLDEPTSAPTEPPEPMRDAEVSVEPM